jgi:peptide/nickel transport system substrate-binding protein
MRGLAHNEVARIAVAFVLVVGILAPAIGIAAPPVTAANPLILRVGTTQDLSAMNPWNAYAVVDYEAFQLNYDFLVGFGDNLEPIPGYAESWTQSSDGKTWTFKIRAGMKWSDGQPATSEDARSTIQLVLDAAKAGASLGFGYLDPYVTYAGVESVAATDPTTLVITTKYPTDRVLSMVVPILPKHVWGKETPKTVGDFANAVPVVGTGPYQAVEWKTGQYARFVRNPYYWGTPGAAEEVVLRFFPDAQDTMVQAFKKGELDYIRNPSPQQFNQLKTQPGVVAIAAPATGFEELGFNCYGKDIAGGGASTRAFRDAAFRDALGYAIDKQTLLDKAYLGYGTIGTTQVPPYYVQQHVEPTNPRTFDISLAKQKLEAAGYKLNAQGQRLDKENKPLNLRLYFPNTDPIYATFAQYITDWFGQLGIKVLSQALDGGTLADLEVGPTADTPAKAKLAYDMFIWGWVGDNGDPTTLLQPFLTSSIGSQSDSQYSNPAYDALFTKWIESPTAEERKAAIAEMQQIIYDDAPYHILTNSAELHVYRSDKFANWKQMPVGTGTPFFVMGNLNYTLLTDATAVPPPTPATSPTPAETPSASAPSATSAATGAPTAASATVTPASPAPVTPATPAAGTSDNSLLLVGGAVALVLVLAAGIVVWRRRQPSGPRTEEE